MSKPNTDGAKVLDRLLVIQNSIFIYFCKQKTAYEIVPQNFFDHIVSKLRDAVGPMAGLIVEDHISLLGEARNRFPKNRLHELFDRICEEILDDKLKNDFQQSMSEDLRAL